MLHVYRLCKFFLYLSNPLPINLYLYMFHDNIFCINYNMLILGNINSGGSLKTFLIKKVVKVTCRCHLIHAPEGDEKFVTIGYMYLCQ